VDSATNFVRICSTRQVRAESKSFRVTRLFLTTINHHPPGVDYLKFDNCRDCPATTSAIVQFAQMATALNATGRRIFYSNELIPTEAAGMYVVPNTPDCCSKLA
jgi:hypothetical protein